MPFPSPGVLPDLAMEARSPALQADSLPSELPGKPIFHKSYQHDKTRMDEKLFLTDEQRKCFLEMRSSLGEVL